MTDQIIQCACGETIKSVTELIYAKAEDAENEVKIVCPNPVCIFQEIGRCKYKNDEFKSSNLIEAEFIASFSTWNAINNGVEKNTEVMKKMLIEIVNDQIPKNKDLKRRDKK